MSIIHSLKSTGYNVSWCRKLNAIDHVAYAFTKSFLVHSKRNSLVGSTPSITAHDPSSSSSKAMGLGSGTFDTSIRLSLHDKEAIQRVTAVVAGISVGACLISLYWFLLMRRDFRRTLVMLLIISDLLKSLWFMIFPIVSLASGGIPTTGSFCQAGGFLLQAGIESGDAAIFFMSLHMSLQIFHSTSSHMGAGGLSRYRIAVIVLWITVPAFMAALAFIHSTKAGYLSQGAFCTLPIRPFWYRLALAWIPRYLILTFVFVTAVRIYLHVGAGLAMFAKVADTGSYATDNLQSENAEEPFKRLTSMRPSFRKATSYVTDIVKREPSTAGIQNEKVQEQVQDHRNNQLLAVPHDAYLFSTNASAAANSMDEKSKSAALSANSVSEETSMANSSNFGNRSAQCSAQGSGLVKAMSAHEQSTAARRRAVQRQTRLLFIYPCVYLILSIFPFIQHCFNYSDYFAQHPVFVVSLLGPVSLSAMGIADCLVFCLREKPWSHVRGSDGTLLGSFCWWRFVGSSNRNRRSLYIENEVINPSRNLSGNSSALAPTNIMEVVADDKMAPSTSDEKEGHKAPLKFMKKIHIIGSPDQPGVLSPVSMTCGNLNSPRSIISGVAEGGGSRATATNTDEPPLSSRKEWFDRRESWLSENESPAAENSSQEEREWEGRLRGPSV